MPWRTSIGFRLDEKTRKTVLALPQEKADQVKEIRLRMGHPPIFVTDRGTIRAGEKLTASDFDALVIALCDRSKYAYEREMAQGYIPLPGGHRAGLCGRTAVENGRVARLASIDSVCIRIARWIPGVDGILREHMLASDGCSHRVLVLGPPASGKTTALRAAAVYLAGECGLQVAVCDEREELFPAQTIRQGAGMDVLAGLPKAAAMMWLIRSMSPQVIVMDEIGRSEDVEAILEAARCGIGLLATAHLDTQAAVADRPMLRALLDAKAFDRYVLLDRGHTCVRVLDECGRAYKECEKADGQYGSCDGSMDRHWRSGVFDRQRRTAAHCMDKRDETMFVADE